MSYIIQNYEIAVPSAVERSAAFGLGALSYVIQNYEITSLTTVERAVAMSLGSLAFNVADYEIDTLTPVERSVAFSRAVGCLGALSTEIQNTEIDTPSTTNSVTVPLTGVTINANYIRWSDNYSLGSVFDANGEEQELSLVDLNNANPSGRVVISISGINNRFTPAFEASGRIIFEASDGTTLEVTIANADMTEIYQWTPFQFC